MWMFRGVLMNVFVKLKPWWDRSQEQQPDRDLRSERTATVQCLRTHSAVLDRAPRLPAAVPGGPRLPEARGAALVHPLPGRAEPAGGRLGRRLSASRRIGCRALEGRGSPQARPVRAQRPPERPCVLVGLAAAQRGAVLLLSRSQIKNTARFSYSPKATIFTKPTFRNAGLYLLSVGSSADRPGDVCHLPSLPRGGCKAPESSSRPAAFLRAWPVEGALGVRGRGRGVAV